jgi:hypothetical protein
MKTKFQFICKWCNNVFFSNQRRERKFCCISHFRLWSKGNINKSPISEEKKKKISKYWKNKKKGPNSKKHNTNISSARKGMKFTKQHRQNMSLARVERLFANKKSTFSGKQEKYLSNKTNEINYAHSSYESVIMRKFDCDNNVLYWTKNHKIKILYSLNGNEHYYIPDFLVTYLDGSKELIEVKGYIYNKEVFKAKNAACEAFCDNNNIKYKILFKEQIYEQEI